MYLHCPKCETTVDASYLIGSSPVCPRCGEPAHTPLSLFSSLPRRYRRPKPKRFISKQAGSARESSRLGRD